jgi:hypothetical protein
MEVQVRAGTQRSERERSRKDAVRLHGSGLALDRVVYGMSVLGESRASLSGKFVEERAIVSKV